MRATKVPPRDTALAATADAIAGSQLFDSIGCNVCHTRSITTARGRAPCINGGAFTVPAALGNKIIHPFSDFLLHDVGTGDGIVQNGGQSTANKVRTAPLWGMPHARPPHARRRVADLQRAILRHAGEATTVINRYRNLSLATSGTRSSRSSSRCDSVDPASLGLSAVTRSRAVLDACLRCLELSTVSRMSDALVRDISDTALWVAYYRAQETDRPDALFRDPFARALAGERGEKIAKAQTFGGQERLVVHGEDGAVRPRSSPTACAAARISSSTSRPGLDTRPYRMDLPQDAAVGGSRSARHPRLQGGRARRRRAGLRLERVRLDLSDVAARRALFARLGAGLVARRGRDRRAAALPDRRDEVASLARDLAAVPSPSRPGSSTSPRRRW